MPDCVEADDREAGAAGICVGECHAVDDSDLAGLLSTDDGTKSGLATN
jgi:hypothetical protein